jgi:hypothetical protein
MGLVEITANNAVEILNAAIDENIIAIYLLWF